MYRKYIRFIIEKYEHLFYNKFGDDMRQIYLCIDLKTFYASVECVERGLDPFQTDLIVADPSRANGAICLAITPKMKSRGIPNRCRVYEIPEDVKPIVAKPRMKKYIEYSARIYGIYLKYVDSGDIHVYSIDEAFLDVTNYLHYYHMSGVELAKTIMNDIYQTTGIFATAGIGTNLYLAKIALDILAKHKEDGIAYLDEKLYQELLWDHLPLTDFWQIAGGTERRLLKHNIRTMRDITLTNPNVLYKEFGINAELLIDHAYGKESCTIRDIKNYKPKSNSISMSQILYEDYDYRKVKIILSEMIDQLVGQLVIKGLFTRCVSVYIGYSKDIIPSLKYSVSFVEDTNQYTEILRAVLKEYDSRIEENVPIRRIGLSFGKTKKKSMEQMSLFQDINSKEKDTRLEKVTETIRDKFGKNSLLKAISYLPGATQKERNRLIGGHNAE